jgi:hypothetical protein
MISIFLAARRPVSRPLDREAKILFVLLAKLIAWAKATYVFAACKYESATLHQGRPKQTTQVTADWCKSPLFCYYGKNQHLTTHRKKQATALVNVAWRDRASLSSDSCSSDQKISLYESRMFITVNTKPITDPIPSQCTQVRTSITYLH